MTVKFNSDIDRVPKFADVGGTRPKGIFSILTIRILVKFHFQSRTLRLLMLIIVGPGPKLWHSSKKTAVSVIHDKFATCLTLTVVFRVEFAILTPGQKSYFDNLDFYRLNEL